MLRRTALVMAAALTMAVLFAACGSSGSSSSSSGGGGGGNAAPPADCRKAVDGTVTLRAKNIKWDTDCLEVSGTSLTIVEQNQDKGIDHPLEVKGIPDGGPNSGKPGTDKLVLTDLKPGTYTYICTVHSNMTGTLYVTAGSSSGAAPAGGPAAP